MRSELFMVAFSSLARIWGECSTIHSLPALFFPFFFSFFFKVEISSRTLIPLCTPGSVHSGPASWDNMWPCAPWRVACELVSWEVTSLGPDSGKVSPLRLRWVKGVCVFRCNLPLALLVEWPRSFTSYCGSMGVQRTPNKSQHTKLTLEKKILPPFLPGFNLATFRSQVQCIVG